MTGAGARIEELETLTQDQQVELDSYSQELTNLKLSLHKLQDQVLEKPSSAKQVKLIVNVCVCVTVFEHDFSVSRVE